MLNGYRRFYCLYKYDIFKDIAEDVEAGFDTLNYELGRLLLKGKNEKVIGSMTVELS